MPEKEHPSTETQASWDLPKMAGALEALSDRVRDDRLGEGLVFSVGSVSSPNYLEIYEASRSMRFRTASGRLAIELHSLASPLIGEHEVAFAPSDGSIGFSLNANGEPRFHLALSVARQSPEPVKASGEVFVPTDPHGAATDRPGAEDEAANEPVAPETPRKATKETQPRVTLTGVVRRGPYWMEGKDGHFLRFYIQQNPGSRPVRVYSTGKWAERQRGAFGYGDTVRVTGKLQADRKKMPDGTVRVTHPIYAFGVRKL